MVVFVLEVVEEELVSVQQHLAHGAVITQTDSVEHRLAAITAALSATIAQADGKH